MQVRSVWAWALIGLFAGAGCSSPTSETPSDEEMFKESLAATSVTVRDVAEESSERLLDPLSVLQGVLRDNWVYHLSFPFELGTGDSGTLTIDAQFTDNGKPIPVPSALNDDPILNLDVVFDGTFKGQTVHLDSDLQLRSPDRRIVELSGGGNVLFADLAAAFSTSKLTMDFNVSPIPFGSIGLTVSQPDFGNWTGSATFQGTPVVHVLVSNGARTFDLNINVLTGEIH